MAMKTLIGFVMALVVILSGFAFPQMTYAQSGRGWMNGFVVRESATQAATGATVELTALTLRSGSAKRVAKADDRGEYNLKDIPYGHYFLRVSADGYMPYEIPIYIMPDVLTKIHVALTKK
jgi:hypothetical protein